ncbi:hypothetical protein GCM10027190_12010 [Spirosoma areae]
MLRFAARWASAKLLSTTGTATADRKKYGGLGVPELRRLRQLEEENQQLKQLVADLSLDKQMLQDVIKKKL